MKSLAVKIPKIKNEVVFIPKKLMKNNFAIFKENFTFKSSKNAVLTAYDLCELFNGYILDETHIPEKKAPIKAQVLDELKDDGI